MTPTFTLRGPRWAAILWLAALAAAEPPRFELRFSPEVHSQPYTGRVYLMTTQREGGDPKQGPDWFKPEPFFALDVRDWKPGEPLQFDPERTLGYPVALSALPDGTYFAQAVLDLNGWRRSVVSAPGNAHSATVRFEHSTSQPATARFDVDQRVSERPLTDSERVKFVELRSELLSRFHRRDVAIRAAVILPEDYADSADDAVPPRYPTLYEVPGFGGGLGEARRAAAFDPYASAGVELVRVLLDPEAPTGHHVFADSDNNGPWAAALVTELIPHLEREYRLIAAEDARLLTGGSSGGWSSLWLQVTYPEVFGGVWSLCPDPVDFRAFQNVNIYEPGANHYFNPDGSLKECSRPLSLGHILVKGMCDMETVLGRGGQYQSFEAVFSPRAADGGPKPLWDRVSGKINPEVADAWRRYDINLVLRRDWPTLAPKLQGKIHVIVGSEDTFFLEKAVYLLRDTFVELGSDARVTVIPGGTHFLGPPVIQQVAAEVAAHCRALAVTP